MWRNMDLLESNLMEKFNGELTEKCISLARNLACMSEEGKKKC